MRDINRAYPRSGYAFSARLFACLNQVLGPRKDGQATKESFRLEPINQVFPRVWRAASASAKCLTPNLIYIRAAAIRLGIARSPTHQTIINDKVPVKEVLLGGHYKVALRAAELPVTLIAEHPDGTTK